MNDDFIDPLNDPRFPDRPNTPDFWRLSETAMQLDGQVNEGDEDIEKIFESLCDMESLLYITDQRSGMLALPTS